MGTETKVMREYKTCMMFNNGCSKKGMAILMSLFLMSSASIVSNYMLHKEYVSIREDLDMYSASVKKSEEKTSSLFDVVKTNSDQFSRMANMGYVGQYSQDDISEIKEKLSSIEESINIIKVNKVRHIKNDSDAIQSIEGDISIIHNIISDKEKR